MSEVRRCRRCKRKRMDDEPPEVKQYKTCAKCRIIERQKKKSRKPLAEETVLYGMKQFQQQNQNTSFLKDDLDYDSYSKYDSYGNQKYQYSYQYDNNTPTYPSTQTTATTNSITNIPQTYNLNYQMVAQKILPLQSSNLPNDLPVNCDICDKKLDPNDELTITYKLCIDCYSNPFKLFNVFEDFNEFLSKINDNKSQKILNYIFIKEIDKNFIDNLNGFVNDYKFKENILDNLCKIYIEPIISSVDYKFVPISSNLNERSSERKTIKAFYKCSEEINDKLNCHSNLFLDYNLTTNILKIKFNHNNHNYFQALSEKFVKYLKSLIEELSIGEFNEDSGKKVWDNLNNEEFKDTISELKKEEFVSNFGSFNTVAV
ncbi:hypothetical protein CLIB1444_02S12706 [[Candida] jaroonii]|uniref:Uncharacterized protein n=1 Tax=[Candida] jaroonii TaxID=467808 RepID=A0ACA9Y4D8_9ASCO|nr:hypothetical protein CLIB1444_02S12706 [[Candida] jaroonii]